jgi:hypothetical protein
MIGDESDESGKKQTYQTFLSSRNPFAKDQLQISWSSETNWNMPTTAPGICRLARISPPNHCLRKMAYPSRIIVKKVSTLHSLVSHDVLTARCANMIRRR